MPKGSKGLITDSDKQKFLRDLYMENAGNKLQQKLEEVYSDEYRYDDCPYCHKPYNFGTGQRFGELPEKWIVSECPHCKQEVWTRIKVQREGDLFEGYRWVEHNQMYRKEEIPNKARELDTGERNYGKADDIFVNLENEKKQKTQPDRSPILRRYKT